jgi:hypothetical protein
MLRPSTNQRHILAANYEKSKRVGWLLVLVAGRFACVLAARAAGRWRYRNEATSNQHEQPANTLQFNQHPAVQPARSMQPATTLQFYVWSELILG